MPRFISTKAGRINLDHVISIGDEWEHPTVTYQRGDVVLATTYLHNSNHLDRMLSEILPAHPGAFIWNYWIDRDENDGRPTAVVMTQEPVIAWLVNCQDGYLTPIGTNDHVYTDDYLVPLSDGRLHKPIDTEFHSMEAAKRGLLNDATEAWGKRKAADAT